MWVQITKGRFWGEWESRPTRCLPPLGSISEAEPKDTKRRKTNPWGFCSSPKPVFFPKKSLKKPSTERKVKPKQNPSRKPAVFSFPSSCSSGAGLDPADLAAELERCAARQPWVHGRRWWGKDRGERRMFLDGFGVVLRGFMFFLF